MSRGWAIAGLVIVVLMCLVPPKKVAVYDHLGAAADEVFGGGLNGDNTNTKVVYRPIGVAPTEGEYESVEDYQLATQRLLLQILVVVVLFGGIGILVGRDNRDGNLESG